MNIEQTPQVEETITQTPIKSGAWRKKKILGFSFLIFVAFGLLVLSLFIKKPLPKSAIPTLFPTPTPVALPPYAYQNLSIVTTPEDKSTNNSLFATVSAIFSRPLSPAEEARVKITISPNIAGRQIWSNTKEQISFIPSTYLSTNTTYTALLSYGNVTKTWSFTTVPSESVSQQDQNNIQLQSDGQFGQWQSQLYTTYPWYDNLPLQTNDYFTYFDTSTKQFISSLYVSQTDSGKIQSLKQEVIQQLQSFGVDTTAYKFVWNITP